MDRSSLYRHHEIQTQEIRQGSWGYNYYKHGFLSVYIQSYQRGRFGRCWFGRHNALHHNIKAAVNNTLLRQLYHGQSDQSSLRFIVQGRKFHEKNQHH